MRKRLLAMLVALVAMPAVLVGTPAVASPAEEYNGPYFGEDNFPPGCIRDMSSDDLCHHMRTGLNALDSPVIDVLILVPVSPTAERDMRIMRQAIEMWDGGIDYLARQMGLDWLADGVEFHITVDQIDLSSGQGGELTTYPLVDPEIVVIATNPVGGIGIGVDPVDFVFTDEDLVPCHNVENPFDFEHWENLPGFDSHHDGRRSGTYVEDCGGAGGNICVAVNGAIDPAPEQVDFFGLFDLVAHEVGHCLTIGHVGDGAEGDWGVVPTNDIMAYSQDPPDLTKCVSTLDVEGFALRMSRYLDVNDDKAFDGHDLLLANDQIGQGGHAFQVQHPNDHLYASSTGSPLDCPQPDLGLVPGERTDWTPTPEASVESVLTVTSPDDGAVADDGVFQVTGTAEKRRLGQDGEPTESFGSDEDAHDDASSPITEILRLNVEATAEHVQAVITLEDLWPRTDVASPTSYSVLIDGRRYDSFVRYPVDANPMTWDNGAGAYMPAGTSTWDLAAKTVTFTIPLDHLVAVGIEAPYFVSSRSNVGSLLTQVADDYAPDQGEKGIGVAGAARVVDLGPPGASVGDGTKTVNFEHDGGNTFYPEQSTLGVTTMLGLDLSHEFPLIVTEASDVALTLTWTDAVGGADLDLYVTGAADSGTQGATGKPEETVYLSDVIGDLDILVEPFLVTDPLDGSTYTLTAEVTPLDGSGAPDDCQDATGDGTDGCPVATEHVRIYVDGAVVGSQAIDTAYGSGDFAIT
ncbi:MAG TPA: hypothetical protein VMN58_02015, partial [Acidimicrobiales bacterium]|nr:hypothetical protein [Acidimicrobiales bacterium]